MRNSFNSHIRTLTDEFYLKQPISECGRKYDS